MNSKLSLLLLFMMILISINCSEKKITTEDIHPERKNIEKSIGNYFEGWLTGDTTKIGMAMHSSCHLKNIKEGKVVIFDRAKYLSFFKPRPRLENAGGRILEIDITGPVASAKVELETAERLFTDYFNLMQEGDQWYIVDKISTNIQKSSK